MRSHMRFLHPFLSAFVALSIALYSLAALAQTAADTVADNSTGIRLAIPGMLRGPAASKFGSLWTGANDGLQIDTLKLSNKTLNDLFDTIRKVSGRRVTRESHSAGGFEIEGVDRDQTAFYMKAEDRQGEIRAVSITYRNQYEKDARAIAASAQLFPAEQALPVAQSSAGAPLSSQPSVSRDPAPAGSATTADFPIEVVPPTMHSFGINSTAISSGDQRFVASSGDDHVIKLWDVRTGRLIRNVARIEQEHKYWRIGSLSSDGRRLLGYVSDESKVWDTITGKELLSFANEDENAAIMTRSGRYVIVKHKDNSLQVFDPSLGKSISVLKETLELAFSPDGARAIAGGLDRSVYSVDVVSGKRGSALITLDSPAKSISFSPSGNSVAIQSASGSFTLWSPGEGRTLAQLNGSADADFIFSTDGAYCAFDDGKGKVTIIDTQAGVIRTSFASPNPDAQLATFLYNNAELFFAPKADSKVKWSMISVSATDGAALRTVDGEPADVNGFTSHYYLDSDDDSLLLRDLTDWKEVRRFGGQLTLYSSSFSASGSKIAVYEQKKQPKVLDSESGRLLAKCPAQDDVYALAISIKEKWLAHAYGEEGKDVNLCDVTTGATIKTFEGHEFQVKSIAFSADDRQMLSGDSNGDVRLWDVNTGKSLKAFKGTGRDALVVAFSPDGKRLFAGTDDNKVRIWDAATGRELHTLRMLIGPVNAMAVSPDGKRVGAGPYGELTAKQWDVETGKELKRLETGIGGRFTTTSDAKYSADGKSLLAIAKNWIVIWDVNTGQKKLTLSTPDQELKSIAFSQDQSRIVSLDEAGVIRHWNRTTGALLVTIVAFGDGQWLRVTPEGFFDASSPDAAKYLSVVRGLEVYSIDQFYNQLYRPDLVRERLAGDPQGKVRDAAARLDLTKAVASGRAPRVAITGPAAGGKVQGEQFDAEAEIADQGGGIGKIEWRVNGVTLGIEDRGFKRVDQAAAPPGEAKSIKVTRALALTPGENKIAVLAYNEAGLIASEPAEITVTSVQQASQKPNLYVLAVGVNDYWDGALRLNFARADASSLGEGLKQAGGKLYQQVTVRTVLDGDVTAGKLDSVFAELSQKVRPQDVFVFFLAGHGKTVDARFYFLPQDFRYAGEDSIVGKGIGQDQLQSWVSRIKAQKSVLLFDACQSGSLIGERIAMRGIEEKAAIDRMTRAMGRTILTATTDDKPAFEGYHGHGVFTYTLLAGLDEADSDGNGVVDVTELAQYVDRRLPDLTYDVFKTRQVPQMSIVGSNFPLASRASLLSADSGQAAPAEIPTRPTHVVIAPADVKSEANPAASTLSQLAAGTQVYLMRSENGWTLVARDGQKLGYVKEGALVRLQ
jgi:WD40 repeat protein/uncharacterized caspase-like protein